MTGFSKRIFRLLTGAVLLVSMSAQQASASIHEGGDAASGEKLFKANCASCHKITEEVLAAPGLKGIDQRWAGKDALLVKWIQGPQAAAATGDPYVKGLVAKYVSQFGWMAAQAVNEAEIKDIMAYVKSGGGQGGAGDAAAANALNEKCPKIEDKIIEEFSGDSDSSSLIWMIIVGVILAIIGASAANIAKSLKQAVHERDGLAPVEEKTYWQSAKSWMWKHRGYVGVAGVILVMYLVVIGYGKLNRIGVNQGYMPDQPIWFSHNTHACQNEIDCQYCHSSAAKSKHAGIPSVNVCMNCHKGIKKGTISGEKEIAKIYAAIGFDPATGQYKENYQQQPIQWNKVHNLPDHVNFNHSLHVTGAKLDCKQCHGPVQTYSVGRLAPIEEINAQEDVTGLIKLSKPTLTMGWCIECHNKAQIDLASSDYYVEMHKRFESSAVGKRTLKDIMEDGEVTVKEMGGWECGKCHY
jgi:mono/diheme cytochrome c family protein